MYFFWLGLSVIVLAEALYTIWKAKDFYYFFLGHIDSFSPLHFPRVAVIAPCKGMDDGLAENIQSWFLQEYANYKIFFVVETADDPVTSVLAQFPMGELLVAGKAVDSGQKVHNLRYAAERIPADYEAFAFVDSDCRLKPDWLTQLIAALQKERVGSATGYRWFLAHNADFATNLRAVWNSGVLTLLGRNQEANFLWGGSMAVYRDTFQAAGVLQHWKGSISDDYGMTSAMREASSPIAFVPGAIPITTGTISLSGFLSWAFRQLLITRIYNKRLWMLAFAHHMLWLLWFLLGAIFFPLPFAVVFALLLAGDIVKAEIRLRCIESLHPNLPAGNRPYFWLLGPVVALTNACLLIATLFTRTIVWRDVKYTLHSKNYVTVDRPE